MAEEHKKRTFRKYTYRGVDLDDLVKMPNEEFYELLGCRQRRCMSRGLQPKYIRMYNKVIAAKKRCGVGEKPDPVKTHLRNAIIVPQIVGGVVAIYSGKVYNPVEIRPDMIGHYLGELSLNYKPVRHGRVGIGATKSSKFVPLK
jgi:small subunit ribosomal protein S15e